MITTTTSLPTEYGSFQVNYHKFEVDPETLSLTMDRTVDTPLVRVHSSCIFSESFAAIDCDCSRQLQESMRLIAQRGKGAVIYLYQEGRGVGLEKKIQAVGLQAAERLHTAEAFRRLGFPLDERNYRNAIEAIIDIYGSSPLIDLMTNNPRKIKALEEGDIQIRQLIHLSLANSDLIEDYLESKYRFLDHIRPEKRK
jgi:GTP cyclohydrolase II